MARVVVGVSGASGIILALKTVRAFALAGFEIDLVFSKHALYTASLELGKEYAKASTFLPPDIREKAKIHPINDMGAAICSGSHLTMGMVIVPCSMATLAAVAIGLSDNVLRRAADVTIKERRPLVIVPRETPFSPIHLENMLRLAKMGATILPPIPPWYNKPETLGDVEDFIAGKILDLFHVENSLYKRWPTS